MPPSGYFPSELRCRSILAELLLLRDTSEQRGRTERKPLFQEEKQITMDRYVLKMRRSRWGGGFPLCVLFKLQGHTVPCPGDCRVGASFEQGMPCLYKKTINFWSFETTSTEKALKIPGAPAPGRQTNSKPGEICGRKRNLNLWRGCHIWIEFFPVFFSFFLDMVRALR